MQPFIVIKIYLFDLNSISCVITYNWVAMPVHFAIILKNNNKKESDF